MVIDVFAGQHEKDRDPYDLYYGLDGRTRDSFFDKYLTEEFDEHIKQTRQVDEGVMDEENHPESRRTYQAVNQTMHEDEDNE